MLSQHPAHGEHYLNVNFIIIMLSHLRALRSFRPLANKARTRSPTQPRDSNAWALTHSPWESMQEGTWHRAWLSGRNQTLFHLEVFYPKPHCLFVARSGPKLPTRYSLYIMRSCPYYPQGCSEPRVLVKWRGGTGVFTKTMTSRTCPHHSGSRNGPGRWYWILHYGPTCKSQTGG